MGDTSSNGWFQIFFLFSHWALGKWSKLTSIFFKWVATNHHIDMIYPKNPQGTLQWKALRTFTAGVFLGPQNSHWIEGSGSLGAYDALIDYEIWHLPARPEGGTWSEPWAMKIASLGWCLMYGKESCWQMLIGDLFGISSFFLHFIKQNQWNLRHKHRGSCEFTPQQTHFSFASWLWKFDANGRALLPETVAFIPVEMGLFDDRKMTKFSWENPPNHPGYTTGIIINGVTWAPL